MRTKRRLIAALIPLALVAMSQGAVAAGDDIKALQQLWCCSGSKRLTRQSRNQTGAIYAANCEKTLKINGGAWTRTTDLGIMSH